MISIFFTKDLIKKRFDRGGKFLFFKSDIVMWKTFGFIGLTTTLLRTILLIVFNYPLKWEIVPLHLCRLISVIVFIVMATGKVDKLKYVTYLAVIGSFFAFMYLHERSDMINEMGNKKTWDLRAYISGEAPFNKQNQDFVPINLEKIMIKNKVTVYSAGFDMWLTYDFLIVHLSILVFPLVARSAYNMKFSNKELIIYSMLIPSLILISLWLVNIGTGKVADEAWRSNYWYTGFDENNDNKQVLGVLTKWPQNVFTMLTLGLILNVAQHFIWMGINKLRFFSNGKFIQVLKSEAFKDFKTEWKGWWAKSRLNRKK